MENKTIGKFISVLRRANGMTQKELGERLYVSDKTVSRWERDECTPELSLLPAIAEIFGITTDELLRGERLHGGAETTQSQRAKSDRQFRAMLHGRKVRFRNLSIISLGIALAAVILAAVINVSFYKGILAFGIGTVVILGAVVCQLCVVSTLLIRLDEDEQAYTDQVSQVNSAMVAATAGVLIAIVSLFAFILPMGLLGGSNYGLSAGSMALWGMAFAVAALIGSWPIYILGVRKLLEGRGWVRKNEPRRRRMLRTLLGWGIVMVALTAGLAAVQAIGPEVYARHTDTFTDLEAFQDFMEEGAVAAWKEDMVRKYGDEAIVTPTAVFIDVGNDGHYEDVLWPPEFEQAQITDGDGNVLCSYANYASFVREVSWDVDEATGQVAITARTLGDMHEAENLFSRIRGGLVLLMLVNLLAWAVGYVAAQLRSRKTR